ncbi:TerC family protein [Sediminivirga luteola]|uniref:TerC family protein n=1 Tax=Sediminivirga luteola TaxID=1774748 RepID=UPI001F58CE28|nr:TerC family protein [Sediminivirga luteola]MCI2264104.1 TerC family protein [Sediminivirga luteola]
MEINALTWGITILVIIGLLAFDFIFHVRKAHIPTIKEAAYWSAFYVGIALLFGLVFLPFGDVAHMTEYYAGYVTEKALSVDNLFVFLVIIASFKVPREDQQKVLLFGIVFALIARTAFILLGAGLINAWSDVFYIFGIILLLTAGQLLKKELTGDEGNEADNFVIRTAKKWLNTTDYYDGDKLFTKVDGKRMLTPMLLVMVAIGGTDILFAVDSIPAIYGLTQEPYIVFTATAFSLMGLRQLYFLIDGLLDRLIYLSYGLAIILGFIGVKLMLHALHENNLPFINDGENVPVAEVSTELSLLVIVVVLAITVVASLYAPKGRALRAIQNASTYSHRYVLALGEQPVPQDPEAPEAGPPALTAEDVTPEERAKLQEKYDYWSAKVAEVPQKYKDELIEHHDRYERLLQQAHGLRYDDDYRI